MQRKSNARASWVAAAPLLSGLLLAACNDPSDAKAKAVDTDALATDGVQDSSLAALTASDRAAIMQTAGYTETMDGWRNCDGDASGEITEVRDLNGDGRAEVIVTSDGIVCHGMTGQGFQLLTPTGSGWRMLVDMTGIPIFYPREGIAWPDIEIGGPGTSCFPFLRWNGHGYAPGGRSLEGRICEENSVPAEKAAPLAATGGFPPIPKGFYAVDLTCAEAADDMAGGYVYFTEKAWQEADGGSDIVAIDPAGANTWRVRFSDGDLTLQMTGPASFTEYGRSFRHCPTSSVPAEWRALYAGDE